MIPILMKQPERPDDADNPIRIVNSAACPTRLWEAFEKRFGVTLIQGYGMSEIGMPLMSSIKERKPAACGKPHRDCLVKLVDDNGIEVGPNTTGEFLMRPLKPYCMLLEYYKMPEKTVEVG
jgi:crotonobetaine/carnitine-CoA ligase